jgi:ribosomal protein S8
VGIIRFILESLSASYKVSKLGETLIFQAANQVLSELQGYVLDVLELQGYVLDVSELQGYVLDVLELQGYVLDVSELQGYVLDGHLG